VKNTPETTRWAGRYQAALRRHLEQNPDNALEAAPALGRQAVILGLETLDLALFHEKALLALVSTDRPVRTWKSTLARAAAFFAEANVAIENTHHPALSAADHVHRLTRALRKRTEEATASAHRLRQVIVQRRSAESALKKSQQRLTLLLRKSGLMHHSLRCQARALLTAQEASRHKASSQLHDEIAQALLAIHIRLLTLKTTANSNRANLEKEFAVTKQLLRQSITVIRRVAHELGSRHAI
jgi:signal transduction histidine kinase